MALNLNDREAVNYGNDSNLYPLKDSFGALDCVLLAYTESGPVGSETNDGDKEYDLATCEVLSSTNPEFKKGDVTAFWFQTGGDGVNKKNRLRKISALQQFVAAAEGVSATSKEYKGFDFDAARKKLLARDFEAKETGIRLRATKGNETDTPGSFWVETAFSPLAAE